MERRLSTLPGRKSSIEKSESQPSMREGLPSMRRISSSSLGSLLEGSAGAPYDAEKAAPVQSAELGEITAEKAFIFSKRRLDGKELNRMDHLIETGRRVVQAIHDVRQRAIDSLTEVEVFDSLRSEQIETLYEAMVRGTYQV